MIGDHTSADDVPAFLLWGAVFGYIGLTGQALTRFRFRDIEFVLDFLNKVAASETAPDPVRRAAVEALKDEAPDLPDRSRREVQRTIAEYETTERACS